MSGMKDLLDDRLYESRGYGYPARPGWKEPTTSREAADAAAKTATCLRDLVRAAVAGGRPGVGVTADEVAELLNKSILAIRPRVSELAAAGEIERIEGLQRRNKSGLKASCWRLKESR